jgi:hypothetical protein
VSYWVLKTDFLLHEDEKSFLKDFFNSVFTDPNDPRCQPFLDMFLQQTKYTDPRSSKIPQFSRLQTLFYLTPNRANGAFLGLDQNINAVKGNLWTQVSRIYRKSRLGKILPRQRKTWICGMTCEYIQMFIPKVIHQKTHEYCRAMAWSILKIPVAQAKFKQVNKDIYQGLWVVSPHTLHWLSI